MATKTEMIEMIEAAQAAWTKCDWTHELRDLDGDIQYDENENAIMCEGGNDDSCDYCRRATASAMAAIALGDRAIKALRAGDIDQAKRQVSDARDLESEWGDCPAWREVANAMDDIQTYDGAYSDSDVPDAVRAAIKHANWFSEEDDRLRLLAHEGKAQEIRNWADEIRNDFTGDTEDDAYWQITADMWDAVADAVDELRTQTEIA